MGRQGNSGRIRRHDEQAELGDEYWVLEGDRLRYIRYSML